MIPDWSSPTCPRPKCWHDRDWSPTYLKPGFHTRKMISDRSPTYRTYEGYSPAHPRLLKKYIFISKVKPGLHISCKDRKHIVPNTFLSFSRMLWCSQGCNDRKYSYITRNICNRCVGSPKVLFGASSVAPSTIVTTVWKPGSTSFLSETGLRQSTKLNQV